jgi:DNA polymerase-3 subunit delta'
VLAGGSVEGLTEAAVTADEAFEELRRGFESDRLAHAYVVEGAPRGAAQRLAEKIMSLVHCEALDKPCGACRACVQVARHTHPDVLWIEPQSKARQILIKEVRAIQQRLAQTSLTSAWKGCVLVAADRLTDAAANAFLKTLEEPAGRSLLLLLSANPQYLLPTIASRCQYLRVSEDEETEQDPWSRRVVEVLAQAALPDLGRRGKDGAPRAVFALGSAAGVAAILAEMKATVAAEVREEESAEATEAEKETLEARIEARYRERRADCMRALLLWYRDVFLLACGGAERHVHYRGHVERLRRAAAARSYRQALRDVQTAERLHRQLDRQIPEGFVLDCGFCHLS